MKKQRTTLKLINEMLEPRHLFILPEWAEPEVLDDLLKRGYLTCRYQQRDENGRLNMVMGLQLTSAGLRMASPRFYWPRIVWRTSLAGVSSAIMSLVILYWC